MSVCVDSCSTPENMKAACDSTICAICTNRRFWLICFVYTCRLLTEPPICVLEPMQEGWSGHKGSTGMRDIFYSFCNGQVRERTSRLPGLAGLSGLRISPLSFEKDDDTNFHMDFIRSFANLRARNYSIEEVDALQVRPL